MNILILILTVYGITKIITSGTIFDPIKSKLNNFFQTLFNCPLCTSFWVGAFLGAFYGPFPFWNIIFNGAFYAGCIWIITCLVQFLGNGYDPNRSLNVIIEKEPLINTSKQYLKG
jgi:hypothetical protein